MEKDDPNQYPQKKQPPSPQFDDIQDLYVGHLPAEARGSIRVEGEPEPLEIRFWGEVLFYEDPKGNRRLRRVALYGSLVEPGSGYRIGLLSLTGPLAGERPQPGPADTIEGLRLQLHYEALSSELPAFYEDEDSVFPQVEQVDVSLTLAQPSAEPDESVVQLEVSLTDAKLVDRKLGVVQGVTLDPTLISFRPAGAEAPRGKPLSSIPSHCGPPSPECPDHLKTVMRRLPIKFVNLSLNSGQLDVQRICRDQINSICEVWRNKAALELTVWPNQEPDPSTPSPPLVPGDIEEGTEHEKGQYHELDRIQEYSLKGLHASGGHVEVYLVDELLDRTGGGVAYDCGKSSAFCILGLDKAVSNAYLLAHELGHVLGLSHPGKRPCPGSEQSIMEAAKPNQPNSNVNTEHNLRIFGVELLPNCTEPLNPIVRTTGVPDCFHPDEG